jgi:NADP-dependent 3-hydroxy acid dehydrogenase YdfG
MEKIKSKKILIAGATGTIGAHTSRLLQGAGAELYLTGRRVEKLRELALSLNIAPDRCYALDLTEEESVNAAAKSILQSAGTIDILINATGIGIIKPIEQLTTEDMMKSLAVNLLGPFHLIKAFVPSMKEQKKGLIINIPGILGKTPMAGAAAYSASKYGLNGMMKSLREELKRTDIRITQLFLGGVDTNFWDTIDLRVQRDKMIIAEEAAKAIWFLCQQPTSGVVSEMVIQPFNHQVI